MEGKKAVLCELQIETALPDSCAARLCMESGNEPSLSHEIPEMLLAVEDNISRKSKKFPLIWILVILYRLQPRCSK